MIRVGQTLRMPIGTAVWAFIGTALWMFLLSPYWVSTFGCWNASPQPGETSIACLKLVANELRSDSNIATYVTATVAAAIALQLANRTRDDHERTPSEE
jgi:hypothetical protein